MNLASRCREAISHVAMLKNELSMHQTRAQEALKFQREQTQRMASNLSADLSRLSQSFESGSTSSSPDRKTEMQRVLSTISPPPPPPPRTPAKVEDPPEEKFVDQEEFHVDGLVSSDEEDTVEDTLHRRSVLDVVESLSDSPPSKPPQVYSTPNRNRKEDRWTPNIDSAPGQKERDPNGMTLFPKSASPKVGGSLRQRNYNEEFPSDMLPQPSSTAHRTNAGLAGKLSEDDEEDCYGISSPTTTGILDRHSGMITLNSIDAFEASFDTTFPSTFAQSRSSRETRTTEIYNPFAPSPARSIGRVSPATPPSQSRDEEISPAVVRTANTSSGSPFATPPTYRPDYDSDDSLQYETPPKDRPSPERTPNGEPTRPHKTASAEARARYEKALQPRGANSNDSQASATTANAVAPFESDAHKSGGFHIGSPSNLLKRIQERRKQKEQSMEEKTPEQNRSPRQENTILQVEEKEEHYFDERRDQGTPESLSVLSRFSVMKNRRLVKQPVSYAEPPLNTKIRQGHSYFPKSDEPRIVTPEQVTHAS